MWLEGKNIHSKLLRFHAFPVVSKIGMTHCLIMMSNPVKSICETHSKEKHPEVKILFDLEWRISVSAEIHRWGHKVSSLCFFYTIQSDQNVIRRLLPRESPSCSEDAIHNIDFFWGPICTAVPCWCFVWKKEERCDQRREEGWVQTLLSFTFVKQSPYGGSTTWRCGHGEKRAGQVQCMLKLHQVGIAILTESPLSCIYNYECRGPFKNQIQKFTYI